MDAAVYMEIRKPRHTRYRRISFLSCTFIRVLYFPNRKEASVRATGEKNRASSRWFISRVLSWPKIVRIVYLGMSTSMRKR